MQNLLAFYHLQQPNSAESIYTSIIADNTTFHVSLVTPSLQMPAFACLVF